MRERLIELLEEAYNNYLIDDTRVKREKIIDYLLENSVVVLPCELGDDVWSISKDRYCIIGERTG